MPSMQHPAPQSTPEALRLARGAIGPVQRALRAHMHNSRVAISAARLYLRWSTVGAEEDPRRRAALARSLGRHARDEAVALGPSFVKIGQMMSSRPDVIDRETAEELEKLQDLVPPMPWREVEGVLRAELGASWPEHFRCLDREPQASASVGQVHHAVLYSGVEVCVKVQRPRVREDTDRDLEALEHVLSLAHAIGVNTGTTSATVLADMGESMRTELDFASEGKSMRRFRDLAVRDGVDWLVVPRVMHRLTTGRVLVSEWVNGVKLTDTEGVRRAGVNPLVAAEALCGLYARQVVHWGFVHADPHPGNVGVTPDGRMVLYDFGMVTEVPPEIRETLPALLTAAAVGDTRGLVAGMVGAGLVSPVSNREDLALFLGELLTLANGGGIEALTMDPDLASRLARDKPFVLPAPMVLLVRALASLQGTVRRIDENFSPLEAIKPYIERIVEDSMGGATEGMAENVVALPARVAAISGALERLEGDRAAARRDLQDRLDHLSRTVYAVAAAILYDVCVNHTIL